MVKLRKHIKALTRSLTTTCLPACPQDRSSDKIAHPIAHRLPLCPLDCLAARHPTMKSHPKSSKHAVHSSYF